jgi:hypothetical protein
MGHLHVSKQTEHVHGSAQYSVAVADALKQQLEDGQLG